MRAALEDPALLGGVLAGPSWAVWRALLIAAMGEALTTDERELFAKFTGRPAEPLERVEELWAVVGRRGGKSRAASALAVYLAALCDHHKNLSLGERGLVLFLAQNQLQATVCFGYCAAILEAVPMLAGLVIGKTASTLSLSNGIDLEVRAASFRGLRGVTCVAVIADEASVWYSDEASANVDTEILSAVRPSLATTGGPLVVISSPYAKRGAVYDTHRQHYGAQGDPLVLVAQGASREFNPSLLQRVVDRALERDPQSAQAEYLGRFRDDVSGWVSRELLEACVDRGVLARPPRAGVRYACFIDPSGGAKDSYTAAVAHAEGNAAVLDALLEIRAPFSPAAATMQVVELLKQYSLARCEGDRYAGEWVTEAFAKRGIKYQNSERDRSEIYCEALPLFMSGRCKLLENRRLVSQLAQLERRTFSNGKDKVDHPRNGSDDVANAACGALVLAAAAKPRLQISERAMQRAHERPVRGGMSRFPSARPRCFFGSSDQR
jgi:hypothetical protein